MSLTTLQKVTLISCSVLCVSLFLPKLILSRGKKDVGQPDVRPGFYPPMRHRLPVPEDEAPWGEEPPDPRTHSTEVMAKVKAVGGTSRTSLLGQVIPVYGFGILLYILFIFYKMTAKRKPAKMVGAFDSIPTSNLTNRISDYDLARLQERLEHTEQLMETVIFGSNGPPDSVRKTKYKKNKVKNKVKAKSKVQSKGVTRQQLHQQQQEEERLLRHLEEISRVMEGRCKDGASPEMEAEEVPYTRDWEGYPAETYPEYAEPCGKRRYDTIILDEPPSALPTAEALAEMMEVEEGEVEEEQEETRLPILVEEEEEEEDQERQLEEEEEEDEEEEEEEEQQGERQPCLSGGDVKKEMLDSPKVRKRITFSDHQDVFRYPRESEEEEGLMEEEEEEEDGETEEEEGETEDDEGETEDDEGETEDDEGETEDDEGEEEDPLMEAESLRLDCQVCHNPEAEAEEELEEEEEEGEEEEEEDEEEVCQPSCVPQGGGRLSHADLAKELGASGLRMRNRRET